MGHYFLDIQLIWELSERVDLFQVKIHRLSRLIKGKRLEAGMSNTFTIYRDTEYIYKYKYLCSQRERESQREK